MIDQQPRGSSYQIFTPNPQIPKSWNPAETCSGGDLEGLVIPWSVLWYVDTRSSRIVYQACFSKRPLLPYPTQQPKQHVPHLVSLCMIIMEIHHVVATIPVSGRSRIKSGIIHCDKGLLSWGEELKIAAFAQRSALEPFSDTRPHLYIVALETEKMVYSAIWNSS